MVLRNSNLRKLGKVAKWSFIVGLTADVAMIGAGYYYYQQLKHSRDFRHKVYSYDSRFIDLYYRANEKYGDGKARERDLKEWGITKVDSFEFAHLVGL